MNNSAQIGGDILYGVDRSQIQFIFVNNSARIGGDILYGVDRSQIHFIFVNNSAGMGGDILYGGQVAFALDGDWNCLESFENISIVKLSQNDLINIIKPVTNLFLH